MLGEWVIWPEGGGGGLSATSPPPPPAALWTRTSLAWGRAQVPLFRHKPVVQMRCQPGRDGLAGGAGGGSFCVTLHLRRGRRGQAVCGPCLCVARIVCVKAAVRRSVLLRCGPRMEQGPRGLSAA